MSRVMHDKWRKSRCRTFNHRLFAFHKIQYIHRALSVVRNWLIKPMTPGFDKLAFMQSSALFRPALAGRNLLDARDEIIPHPICRAVPLNICLAVIDMNRTRLVVQSYAVPVPQLKSKNVGRRADFEHHAVFPEQWIVPAGIRKWSCL